MGVPVVSEQEFEAVVLRSEVPVLVDFYADWCQPCKTMAPELEALASEVAGKAKVVKVDTEASPRLAAMLRVESLPTFVVFAGGKVAGAERGVVPRSKLKALLEPHFPRAQGAIKPAELAMLLKDQSAVAVDTREARTFGRAHVPGAKHMALEEIPTRLAELHMLGMPVLYCRSGKDSKELAEKLAAEGVPVAYLEGGFLGWEAEMLPIER